MNVTIGLLSELGIDMDTIQESIINGMVEKLYEDIGERVERETYEKIEAVLEDKVNEWVTGLLQKPFYRVDRWGDAKSLEPTTIQKVIEDQSLTFMQEKVDSDGKKTDYQGTERYLWAAKRVASAALEGEVKPHVDKLIAGMKKEVKDGMAKVIADVFSYNFNR